MSPEEDDHVIGLGVGEIDRESDAPQGMKDALKRSNRLQLTPSRAASGAANQPSSLSVSGASRCFTNFGPAEVCHNPKCGLGNRGYTAAALELLAFANRRDVIR
jgi:hypothetical protein